MVKNGGRRVALAVVAGHSVRQLFLLAPELGVGK